MQGYQQNILVDHHCKIQNMYYLAAVESVLMSIYYPKKKTVHI